MKKLLGFFGALAVCLALTGCRLFFWTYSGDIDVPPERSHAVRAAELRERGKFFDAVEEFRKHIEVRTKSKSRPADENPAFYYLLIGDTYLEAHCPEGAKEAFAAAKEKGVEKVLVVDRFRSLARWYAEKKCYDVAIETLRGVRELDTLVVDADIDQYHRRSVEAEDLGH